MTRTIATGHMIDAIRAAGNYLTITLTGRPPVRIIVEDWPVISEHIGDHWHASSGIRRDATRITVVTLRVRQHADGRAIVYGKWDHTTRWQGERDCIERAGELVPAVNSPAAIVAAIQRVGRQLAEQSGDDDHCDMAIRECIADLPAEAL